MDRRGMGKTHKTSKMFEWFLLLAVITTLCIGSYESYTQRFMPDYSIMSRLHRHNYLNGIPGIYEPGKGIWHLLGWAGSGMMIIIMLYTLRKRIALFTSPGYLGA